MKELTPQVLDWLRTFQKWDQPYFVELTALSLYKYIYCYQINIDLPEPQNWKDTLSYKCLKPEYKTWEKYSKAIDFTKYSRESKCEKCNEEVKKIVLGPAYESL